ncbi:MAG: glutamate-5-semialdehyde dehydrogenase [Clostridiales bacterium]|nr:glutamate-5-semialdehyde dehydrogenase [Clostridiales bacterium]
MKESNPIKQITSKIKADSFKMADLSLETRNKALEEIANKLLEHQDKIIEANLKDLEKAEKDELPLPLVKRLKFDKGKIDDCISGIRDLIGLEDPLFRTLLKRELDQGLTLHKITCPIGVIGVIFESRPDALVQIATLCLKSGNCAVLKGGSEATNTNRVLCEIIHEAGVSSGIPDGFLTLLETRSDIDVLIKCDDDIDLLIPRGSNAFVRYLMENSKIPVMGHADGVCHVYVDEQCDIDKAIKIITDSKTQYVAACNTLETLLVHQSVAHELLPKLQKTLTEKGVVLKGSPEVQSIIDCDPADSVDWETEYLDLILSIKIVNSIEAAITHINRYGSHHTDSIITENPKACEQFMLQVDSAGVYHNCSTRFADGFRYGFGAEVGISTGKLHARGPVGLDGLVTYKYKLYGNGHIVEDYALGKKQFNFKDL